MKIKQGMVLCEVAGSFVAVPTGEALSDFSGVVHLNKTGRDIWNGVANGLSAEEIAAKLVEDYDGVTFEEAKKCTDEIIAKLLSEGLALI